MIDLYGRITPNGHKDTNLRDETDLPHRVFPISISAGEQFAPAFLAISPNNPVPAIVDHAPADGGRLLALMGSGAILIGKYRSSVH